MSTSSPDLYAYALARTRESAARRELPKIADETGVDYSWLTKFSRGKIPGASYQKVKSVADYYIAREANSSPPLQ